MTVATAPRAAPDALWMTAVLRPVGTIDRDQAERLDEVLAGLAESTSMVVLDLGAAALSGPRAAAVVARAAERMDANDGCLVCVNVDAAMRRQLDDAGGDVIAFDAASTQAPPAGLSLVGRGT